MIEMVEQPRAAAAVMYTDEVALALGRSTEAVRKLAERGSIPAPFRVGRRLAWDRQEFKRWLTRRAVEAQEGVGRASV